jgi:ubiquinone biosynthesis protein
MRARGLSFFNAHETYQDLKRYSHIASVLARHGFGELLHRLKGRYQAPWKKSVFTGEAGGLCAAERLRLAFEELGPTFIKLAQILSSRPDLLPSDFERELSKLQDSVAPFPFVEAKTLIETQFGRPLGELLSAIEETPVAAASLSQVHRARTTSGDEVAVKVQRAGIDEIIEADIRILYEFAGLAERYLPESKFFEPLRLVDEFARTIRRELDFVREGRNIDRFRDHFAGTATVYIPKVYWDLTAPRVLTTEYIKGIKISDLEQLEEAGLDRKTIAANGANLLLREIFEFHFFHADPHPGNLFVLENNVIAPVDFGMTGSIHEEVAQQMSGIFLAVLEKDADSLVSQLSAIGVAEELGDPSGLRLELRDLMDRYYGVPLRQLDLAVIFDELMGIVRRYRLRLPADLIVMAKVLLISEGVGRMLHPEFHILEAARPYARKILFQRLDPSRHLKELSKAVGEALTFFKELPSDMREILLKVRKGDMVIRFEHRGLERFISELDRSSNRLSFAVVIGALIIGSSIIFQTGMGPRLFGHPVLGLVGYLLASVFGIWLLIGIIRSGRL